MSVQAHLFPGVPLALGSAALFGATLPASKLLLAEISPLLLASILYLGAGVGLAIVNLGRSHIGREAEAAVTKTDAMWLAGAVICGGIIAPVLLVYGLAATDASTASLLLNLEGLATMVIAWVVLRENVDSRLLLGAASILVGAILLTWDGKGLTIDAGALLVAAACLVWGIDNNLTRNVSSADPTTVAMLKGLVAGSVNLAIAASSGAPIPSWPVVASAAVVGFFGIGVSLVMFIKALRHLGVARTGAYYSLAPFIGAVLAVLLLAEPVTLRLLLSAALMGLGLYLHLTERHSHEHVHEPLEHDHLHVHDEHHQHQHDGPVTEPHSHWHRHEPLRHFHPHYPDLHHRHDH